MTNTIRNTGRKIACLALAAAALLAASPQPSAAQSGLFSPIVQVDTRVVTRYQLDQRTRFLTLLNAPGDVRALAMDQLTNEALQISAAQTAGVSLTEEEITAGMAEFASRANLSVDQFIQALAQSGVSSETFRDFATAGIIWRKYVAERFGDPTRGIRADDISLAEQFAATDGGERVLLSEIILPANSPEARQISSVRAQRLSQITDETAFSAEARRFSAVPTRDAGGKVPWRALDSLPEEVRSQIAAVQPGNATRPISSDNVIAVFFVRDRETIPAGTTSELAVEYAVLAAPGATAASLGAVGARAKRCDELYEGGKGLGTASITRDTVPFSALPADIAAAVTGLDQYESTTISRGGAPALVMLCNRTFPGESTIDRDALRIRMGNARLTALAGAHLAELKAAANIRRFGG